MIDFCGRWAQFWAQRFSEGRQLQRRFGWGRNRTYVRCKRPRRAEGQYLYKYRRVEMRSTSVGLKV
jgi:hypothetical protein